VQTVYTHLHALGLGGGWNLRLLRRQAAVLRERRDGASLPALARTFSVGVTTAARDLVVARDCPTFLREPMQLHYPRRREPAARVHDRGSAEITVAGMWEARRRLVAAAWRPGRSVSSLAREVGLGRRAVRRCLVELGL
jgi:hypothetical protein